MIRARTKLKKVEIALTIGLMVAVFWGMWSLHSQRELSDRVVRLHILANSDSKEDQSLKLQVRDVILKRATQLLKDTHDRDEAELALRENLPEFQTMAEQKIHDQGYDYPVAAKLEKTTFPTRKYADFTLPAGDYLALRIVIGNGAGHNWWCVVFPPLCTQAVTDLPRTAMAAGLSGEDVKLITGENEGYLLKFKSIEIWEHLKEKFS